MVWYSIIDLLVYCVWLLPWLLSKYYILIISTFEMSSVCFDHVARLISGLLSEKHRPGKWNEMFQALGHLCAHNAKLGQENLLGMMRWMRWHCPPDTGFEIQALAVWGRARYLSVTKAPHNTEFHTWMGKKKFVSFKPPTLGTEPRTLAWKQRC